MPSPPRHAPPRTAPPRRRRHAVRDAARTQAVFTGEKMPENLVDWYGQVLSDDFMAEFAGGPTLRVAAVRTFARLSRVSPRRRRRRVVATPPRRRRDAVAPPPRCRRDTLDAVSAAGPRK